MAGVKAWSRALADSGASTALWQQFPLAILPAGDTLLRSVIGIDAFLSSTTDQFGDAGFPHAWGMYATPTPGGDVRHPIANASATSPRWIFWDQLHWDVLVAQTIAGSTSYIARNSAESKRNDTRIQLLNDTASDWYIYLGVEANPSTLGSPVMQCAVSLSALILYR